MQIISGKDIFKIAKATFQNFSQDKGLKMSASLAYYTALSIGPLILLVIYIAGVFYGQEIIQSKIFSELRDLLGVDASNQLEEVIRNIKLSGKSNIALIIGIISLILTATSVFGDMQDSINTIWKVRAKPKRNWLKLLFDRARSSSLIISIGFLLITTLVINGIVLALGNYLTNIFGDHSIFIINLINTVITFFVISFLFGIIFKMLPDVKIMWKDVKAGAIFTTLMFMIGRYLIGFYITQTATGSAYGAAGTIIVLLVWVYYTAAILYLGAEFTQVYADYKGRKLVPSDYAVHVVQVEEDVTVDKLPSQTDFSDTDRVKEEGENAVNNTEAPVAITIDKKEDCNNTADK